MYEDFLREVRRLGNLGHAASVLRWDQEVVMPEEGTGARAEQISTLSTQMHELLTSERMGRWLEELEPRDRREAAVLREVGRRHERAVRVPERLVEEISRTASEAFPEWNRAKREDDFERFAPYLERLVELKRRYAGHVEPDVEPYEVLFQDFEPYLDLRDAEDLLEEMRRGLSPVVEEIGAGGAEPGSPLGEVPEERQMALVIRALELLGFDFARGRLDTSPHPFSTGNQFDARITTRVGSDPLDSLLSAVHEFGHALYTLGLPVDHYATPLGEPRELTVHESQSRLWENHVGRSLAFWRFFTPVLNETFGTDASPGEVYRGVNRVRPHPVRVESDELTYHLHVALRFEIERDLVAGEVEVDEVPGLWNDGMERYLGIRPESDAEGCLQDVHWSHGSFGYFPTYSLGSMMAAQLYASASEEIRGLDDIVERGEFETLSSWLREEVHRHGQVYTTDELVERATGAPLSSEPFLAYVGEKFGELYGF